MDDDDSVLTVGSAESSSDSGYDIGFLSDCSTSSSKSGCCRLPTCVFEEKAKDKRYSCHHCALNVYRISGHCIVTMSPKTFLYLGSCVTVLDLSRNKIKTLPETISELRNLQELNLSCNELVSLPDLCQRLQKLQVLNLSNNNFSEPPPCLELGMEQLTQLDLSKNKISIFPNPPKCSLLLRILNLSNNYFNSLPLWLFNEQCRSLVELDVSFTFSFDDPTFRSQLPMMKHYRTSTLKSLRKLKICNAGLSLGIISPLSSFESLETLHMGNHLGADSTQNYFPEFKFNIIYTPSTIVELHLPKVRLAGLPDDFNRFKNLEVLDVSHNPLDWLPETFGTLTLLRELMMSDCRLAYLPENFGQLTSLEKLVLSHNKLTDIRRSLEGLSRLELLDVYDNCLEELPVCPEHLINLQMVDLDANYVKLEMALGDDVNGEKQFDVYCRQRARLREANGYNQQRSVTFKVNSNLPSWSSMESLHRSYRRDSLSDASDLDEDVRQPCSYFNNQEEDYADENWDDDSNCDDDEFKPDSVHRYHLPLGLYHFGWTPPIKRRECPVPINMQVNGFVFVPGQSHQKNTTKIHRRRAKNLPVVEGQFDDADVADFPDLQTPESLGDLLRKMYMFVRNPEGLRSKRRCRFHSPYEDCLHHGLWYRLGPGVNFECPEDDVDM